MKNHVFSALLGLGVFVLSACDDGRIYPESSTSVEGKTVVMEGVLEGLDNWASNYRVSIAGFEQADDEYASVSKVITASDIKDGEVYVELSGIKSEIKFVRLSVMMELGTMNISMHNAIQQSFFNTTCANCHGASNRAAAGLYLTEGKSYQALVDVNSKKVEGRKLVETNNAANSVIHMVLNQQSVEGISMDHRDLVSEKSEQTILPLIDVWINKGAKEK